MTKSRYETGDRRSTETGGTPLRIDIAEIKAAAALLFESVEANAGQMIEIRRDFYWNLSADEKYNVYAEPTAWNVGQISEDLETIRAISGGVSEAIPFGLVALSAILRAIGEEIVA